MAAGCTMAFIASLSFPNGRLRATSEPLSRVPLCRRHETRSTLKFRRSSFNGNAGEIWASSLPKMRFLTLMPTMLGTQQKPNDSNKSSRSSKPTPPPPQLPPRSTIFATRVLISVAYGGFFLYALFFGPGTLTGSKELENIVTLNVDDVNTIAFSIFCLLGAIPMNYAVALNPGASKKQKVPFVPSMILSFFTGFGGIGPYLITRRHVPKISREEVESRGPIARILESRLTSVGTAIFSAYTYIRCLGLLETSNDALRDMIFYSSFVDFIRLTRVDRFVCVSTVDFFLLSVLLWGPLTEDMRRRGWFVKGGKTESALTALSILLVPGFGAALYFMLRPPLPNRSSSESGD